VFSSCIWPPTWQAGCITKLYPHSDLFNDVLEHSSSTLRMEAERSSKNSVHTYKTVLCQGTEDYYTNNFGSYIYINIEIHRCQTIFRELCHVVSSVIFLVRRLILSRGKLKDYSSSSFASISFFI